MSGLDLYLSQRTLALLFVYAALAGFCLGGVYDILRILRMLCGDTGQGRRPIPLAVLLFFEDVLFMLTATVTLILLCYYINDGQLRAPAVMGMACGFFVYSHTLGRLAVAVSERAVRLLRRLLALLVRLLIAPVKGLWSLTVGRAAAARRERMTEKRIRALTESAARGFDIMAEDPPENSEPPA
ncbi:MAG: spore cortex biosynthesis protein YabQ [Clostridia bacterium]|nr:spore cortex biosynthesis protein YabQ [Clostridia bacterium]